MKLNLLHGELPLEYVRCALCNADDTRTVFRLSREGRTLTRIWFPSQTFDIVECRKCGLVYVNPRIIASVSSAVYDSDQEMVYFRLTYEARALAYFELLRKTQSWLGIPPQNLLDIGCGDGVLLKVAHELGISGVGTETSPLLRRLVQQELGDSAIWDSLEKMPSSSFDIVVLTNVLEHVHHPAILLAEVARQVRSGGIVIVHVPNFGGFPARLAGPQWKHLEPLEHLYYFTNKTLTCLLERFQLKPIGNFNLIVNKGIPALIQRTLGMLGIYIDNGLGIIAKRQN